MKDILIGFVIVIVGAALIAARFARIITNALEKHQKEQENEED